MITGTLAEVLLPLTRAEAHALLSLARKGRVLLDVDRTFLRHPDQRAAARRAVDRLRLTIESTTPAPPAEPGARRIDKAEPCDRAQPERAPA